MFNCFRSVLEMSFFSSFWLLTIFLWNENVCQCYTNRKDGIVRTSNTVYHGKTLQINSLKTTVSVMQFTGLRYGLVKGRFGKPVPAWNFNDQTTAKNSKKPDHYFAQNLAKVCPQQSGFLKLFENENTQNNLMSEDCLHLNIWTPLQKSNDKIKPVLVFFHGGSFISDSINRKLYNGSQLAANGDLVVVTVNYRLDAFGFLYSGTKDFAPGNQVIWDQLLALEWVQDNIKYFFGDPQRVTIAGWDSGATSVGLHLLSPISQKFFHRAIMLSGSVFSQLVEAKSEKSKDIAKSWAMMAGKKASCLNSSDEWTIEKMNCLQKTSIENVLNILNPLAEKSIAPEIVIGVDRLFPFKTLLEGIERISSSNISLLLGMTDDEGSLVLPIINHKNFPFSVSNPMTLDEAFAQLKELSSMLVTPRGASASQIDGNNVAQFYLNSVDRREEENYRKLIGQALGDFYVTCPMIEFGRRLSSKFLIYQYLYSRKSTPNIETPCLEWMGTCHGTDLSMLFGLPFIEPEQFTNEDRRSSRRLMITISHFIHYGEPRQQQGVKWPSFQSNPPYHLSNITMNYYEFSGVNRQQQVTIYQKDFKLKVCSDLWQKHFLP